MTDISDQGAISGNTFFDSKMAKKGYALNKMCYSFNDAVHRDEFVADEEAYYEKYKLTTAQKDVVRNRDVLGMLEQGGSIYYLAKLAVILGLDVQDVGALQTGMSLEDFNAKLVKAGE